MPADSVAGAGWSSKSSPCSALSLMPVISAAIPREDPTPTGVGLGAVVFPGGASEKLREDLVTSEAGGCSGC